MPSFRKKPVVIEAEQWLDTDEQWKRLREAGVIKQWTQLQGESDCIIPTLEGDMKCSYGDWIITGVKGEHYPCKPRIFEATYEAV